MTPGAAVRPRRCPPRLWGGLPDTAQWERGPPPRRPAVMRLLAFGTRAGRRSVR